MSSNFPPQRINRQRLLSSNSADCSLDTSLVGLLFVNSNSANPNGMDGGSKKSALSPSSQSQRARKVETPRFPDANENDLGMVQQQSQLQSQSYRRPCVRKQQLSIDNNEADVNHDDVDTSMTENARLPFSTPSRQCQTQEISDKEEELLHSYASPIENSTILEEPCPQQRRSDRAQQRLLQLPIPEPIRKSISLPHDLTDQLQNCVIFARTTKPSLHRNIRPSSSIEDYCDRSDEYNCPTSPNSGSSCVSSLSLDESQNYFSDLASVINPPPVHHHHLEAHRIGKKKTGESSRESHHKYCRNESPSHTLSSRRDCVPDQLTFTSLRALSAEFTIDREHSAADAIRSGNEELQIHSAEDHQYCGNESPSHTLSSRRDCVHDQLTFRSLQALSAEFSVERETFAADAVRSSKEELQTHSAEDLDSKEAVLQRHSQHHRYGSDVRSLEPKRPPPYSRRAISSSTTPGIRIDSCNNKGLTYQNHTAMAKQRYQGKKLISRNGSITQISTLDKPALMHQRSGSTITNTTMSSSQYGRYNRSVGGGENSTTSASNGSFNGSSITVNGMVVNGIKHRTRRNENNIPVIGGVVGMLDDHNHVNGNSVYEAAILRKASGLEISTSLDSQVANASSFESPRSNLSHSLTMVDDATSRSTSRSCGVTESSMNGITSASSGTTTQRKRRRRRRAKDEFKYFVGKLVPGPVKVMKAALTKKKTYDLERSSGCLT